MSEKLFAFHYDMKRAMWSADFMRSYAATLADWGCNAILYEVEDKLRFTRHPSVAHADALSPEETRARMADLRKFGLQIIPMVQSLGHAEYVLAKPGYERLRESLEHHDQYDPLSVEARDLVIELIDDTIAAVQPEKYFHLGGDETWKLGQSAACKPVVAEIGKSGLYLRHMLPIIEHVIKRGLRPILWADIVLTHPGIVDKFPREIVWMDWDYWTPAADRWNQLHIWGAGRFNLESYKAARRDGKISQEFIQVLEKYAVDDRTKQDGAFIAFPYTNALRDMGFDVIVAPATRCCGDSMGIPFNAVHLANCHAGARKGVEAGLGVCVTSWTVRHNHPLVNLPGAFAAAMGFRGSAAYDPAELARSFTVKRFGSAMPEFADAIHLAQERVPWSEAREMKPPEQAMEAVKKWLAQIDGQPGGREGLIKRTEQIVADVRKAEAIFIELRARAAKNAGDFDYWIEGARHTVFCASFSVALLLDRMKDEAPRLRKVLRDRREETRRLFAATFPETSVREELAVRYAFHEAVLNAAG